MINKLPEIYEDEMVYSWFCRYLTYSGLWTEKEVANELFVNNNDPLSKLFIGNINDDVRKCIKSIIPIKRLFMDHTMFYAHTGYCSSEYKESFYKNLMKEPRITEMRMKRRIVENNRLKYCPLCIKEDRRKYGETYWHRIHQLRELPICPKHKCKLFDTNVEYFDTNLSQRVIKRVKPIEIFKLTKSIVYENDHLLNEIVEYTKDRFFEQDIDSININYKLLLKENPDIRKEIIHFYKNSKIQFDYYTFRRAVDDDKKNFFTMSAIYYYLESHSS